jgi:hypothetical protein
MLFRSVLGFAVSLAAITAVGCGSTPPVTKPNATATPSSTKPTGEHSHAAHGAGPHGGTITDWGGGKYHVEFTVDHDKQEATVYVLGGDEKTPAPIKAEKLSVSINDPAFEVDAVAQPLDGEPEGSSSRFVGRHDNLGKVQEFAGTITGDVEGTPYSGDFKEEPAK